MHSAASIIPEIDCSVPLSKACVGSDFTIQGVTGPQCAKLRDLGFCESMQVRKLADGRNMICSLCGTRMAISRELAEQVMVSPV